MALPKWSKVVSHSGLNKVREISGTDKSLVEHKAWAQQQAWDEQWERQQERETRLEQRRQKTLEKEEAKLEAQQRTEEAQEEISILNNLLHATLSVNDAIDWDSLKDRSGYNKPAPISPDLPAFPPEPKQDEPRFKAKSSFLDLFSTSRKQARATEAANLFSWEHERWEKACAEIRTRIQVIRNDYAQRCKQWDIEKCAFFEKQATENAKVDALKFAYSNRESDAVYEYCELVLTRSSYPDSIPRDWEMEYRDATKLLVLELQLPTPEDLPQITEVKYVQSRNDFQEVKLSDSALTKFYDSVIYQIALRTIHEVFESDTVDAIDTVAFSGLVDTIDKRTGQQLNACILYVQARKQEFMKIDLSRVDPKECIKGLKGINASTLRSLTPIAPQITVEREDRRFIESRAVVDSMDSSSNIAAMDWEDFEHLIRELFEKEFQQGGGEVKVTRASRDGGVDAVAFDPDPIRGGKIVIQAKRYTGTVGVSAVRDLYGTVLNEGATKGILITTSDYGPDAYEFARAKPLTLLSGGNLLHLLSKHGYQARIDLAEAKRMASSLSQ
jgi:restriction system protein